QGTVLSSISVSAFSRESFRISLTNKDIRLSEFPFILLLEQSKTERLLIEFLEQKGHRVEWETELMNVVQSDDITQAILRLADGTPDAVQVKYILGADGARSRIREMLQIPFEGKTHSAALTIMECDADI